jgi:hypothetical protein
VNGETVYSSDAPEKTRVFEFFPILSFRPGKDMLIQGLAASYLGGRAAKIIYAIKNLARYATLIGSEAGGIPCDGWG